MKTQKPQVTLATKEPIPVLKTHPAYSWSSQYFTKWTGKHFLVKHSQRGQNCCKCLFSYSILLVRVLTGKKHETPGLKASSAQGGSSHLLSFSCLKNVLKWRAGNAEREGSTRHDRVHVYHWVVRAVTWITKIQVGPLGLVSELCLKCTNKSGRWDSAPLPARRAKTRVILLQAPGLPAYSHSLAAQLPP